MAACKVEEDEMVAGPASSTGLSGAMAAESSRPGSASASSCPNRSRMVHLYDGDGHRLESIPADYEDSFTLETVETLAEQYLQEGKEFILARVKTRDKHEVTKTFYSYYDAHQLNKLLFRRRGREVVSRYSRHNPLVSINPRTNSDIIGEVFYFKIASAADGGAPKAPTDAWAEQESPASVPTFLPGGLTSDGDKSVKGKQAKELEDSTEEDMALSQVGQTPAVLPHQDDSSDLDGTELKPVSGGDKTARTTALLPPGEDLKGHFIGTDYNFAHSKELRDVFKANAFSDSDTTLAEDLRALGMQGMTGEQEQDFLNVLARLSPFDTDGFNQTIDVPYSRAVVFGMVSVLYILVAFLIFSYAVQHTITPDSVRSTKWFWSILPFLSFLTDRLIAYLYHVQESRIIVMAKITLWTFYVLSPVVLFHKEVRSYVFVRDILDIIFPVVFLLYSFGYYIFMSSKRRLV